jgi:hypothetical protein
LSFLRKQESTTFRKLPYPKARLPRQNAFGELTWEAEGERVAVFGVQVAAPLIDFYHAITALLLFPKAAMRNLSVTQSRKGRSKIGTAVVPPFWRMKHPNYWRRSSEQ